MGSENRNKYVAPMTLVFDVAQESVVCATTTETNGAPTFNGFNNEEEW
jgi:hypothetical protein